MGDFTFALQLHDVGWLHGVDIILFISFMYFGHNLHNQLFHRAVTANVTRMKVSYIFMQKTKYVKSKIKR